MYLFGFLSITGLGFILLPNLLTPVYVAWLKVAQFLGRVVTTFVLSLTFYLVITPMALIGRILGKTFLPQKPDPNIPSYWVLRDEASQPKERFSKRY